MSAFGPKQFIFKSIAEVKEFLDSCINNIYQFDQSAKEAIASKQKLFNLDFSEEIDCYGGKTTLLETAAAARRYDMVEFLVAQNANINLRYRYNTKISLLDHLIDRLENSLDILKLTNQQMYATQNSAELTKLSHAYDVTKITMENEFKIIKLLIQKTTDLDILNNLDFLYFHKPNPALKQCLALPLEKEKNTRIAQLQHIARRDAKEHTVPCVPLSQPIASPVIFSQSKTVSSASPALEHSSSSTLETAEELELKLQLLEIQRQQTEIQLKLLKLQNASSIRHR